jgi:outer membrane protein assembly factor BamA
MRVLSFLLFIGLVTVALTTKAQTHETSRKKRFMGFVALDDTVTTEKSGTVALPLIYFTPDTRWAFGAAGAHYFKLEPKEPSGVETRMSYIQFLADYTQNKQLDVWSIWNVFTPDEDYLLKGELRFRTFPDRFYELGNQSRIETEEFYEYSLVSIKSLFMKKLAPGFFAGVDYHFEREFGFKYTEGGLLQSGQITGYNGATGSALGLVAVYDTRDNVINAYEGKLAEFSSYFYRNAFGSTFNFSVYNGLYQQYWEVKPKHVIAIQNRVRLSFGDVPFLDLSTLGSDDLLRGYPKNRFRDHHFAASQVEYRFPLFWRFGLVGFAGLGDVFNNLNDLSIRTTKYSVGTGLRFIVNPAERLNIRLDYGHGREGGYFYFIVSESF